MPETAEIFRQGEEVYFTAGEEKFIDHAYSQSKSISIDYGIMEKAPNVHVLLCEFGWSDLGTWKSLYEISDKDKDGNALKGKHLLYDTQNCIIRTSENKVVVVEGLDDYIVAEFDNVFMVCKKDSEQKVKQFLSDARERFGEDFV